MNITGLVCLRTMIILLRPKRMDIRMFSRKTYFIHHFGSVSFKKLEDETYRKLFEQNKAYYEQKWGEKWRKPEYRQGIV